MTPDATPGSGTGRVVAVFAGRYASATGIEDVEALARAFPQWRFVVFQEFPPRSRRRSLRRRWKRLRAEPLGYPAAVLRHRLSERAPRPSHAVTLPAGFEGLALPNVEYVRCGRLHDAATLEAVCARRPWLGIAIQAPILKPPLFRIPERGTINLHKSLLPEYRGMPPGFWELHDGAEHSGVTIHWIDEGLDTGGIVAQNAVPIPPYTTPAGLQALLDDAGTRLLLRTVAALDEGAVPDLPQGEARTPTRGRPPARVAAAVRRARLRRRRDGAPRRSLPLLRDLVLAAYVHLWCPPRNALRALRGRARTAVLLYHRVDDAFLDSVTVGIEQFDRQLAWLARHYRITDPAEFLASAGRPCRRTRVVVTFDDGYRDNRLAARLLRRHGIPAVFFISTRIVGTDRGFPHDLRRLGRVVPALRWDEADDIARHGFLLGNHTADHADLGASTADEALAQIATAARDLDARPVRSPAARWLAYPYGGRDNITEDVRRRLPEAGIDFCFSAYGGANPPAFDRWNVLRQAVDHSLSLLRLRAAIEGWPA